MEANYFTTLWWFSPCTDMNPLPTSFPTASLWVVPEHQLWMPASCLELVLVIYFTYLPVKFGKPTKAFSTLVSKKKKKKCAWAYTFYRFLENVAFQRHPHPMKWEPENPAKRQTSFSTISFQIPSGNHFLSSSPCIPCLGSQGNLLKWLITEIIKGTKQMLALTTHNPSFTSPAWPDSDETT